LVKENRIKLNLTIAGSGSLENDLKEKVQQLNLENHVKFAGFITDPYPILLNSDLYILNSFSEGFSNSLVEAMYSKTPSLSTNVGAAPEIISDGINGFLIPADDDALYKKLKEILNVPKDEREKIGERGHQTIVENFSLEKHVDKLMEIYK
jgi:glycosyltransferase involved in cell wall biosynthesis